MDNDREVAKSMRDERLMCVRTVRHVHAKTRSTGFRSSIRLDGDAYGLMAGGV